MSESIVKPRRTSLASLLGFAGFAIALTVAFCGPFVALAQHAVKDDLDSYVLLIPFVAAYLVYLKRDQFPTSYRSSLILATIPAAIGTFALGATWLRHAGYESISQHDSLTLHVLAYVSWLIAGGASFLGRDWMKLLAFPAAFLYLMAPLPDGIVYLLETGSKVASTETANLLFLVSGTPVLREGSVFQLPGIAIEVAQECSGIRSSLVLFIVALLASHLFLSSNWRRWLFVALVIPLGFFRNGIRILVLGLLAVHLDPGVLDSAIHKRGGPLFFAFSLIPFCILLWCLRRSEERSPRRHKSVFSRDES